MVIKIGAESQTWRYWGLNKTAFFASAPMGPGE